MSSREGDAERRTPGKDAFPGLHRLLVVSIVTLGGLSVACSIGGMAAPIFNMELFNRVLTTRNQDTMWEMLGGVGICLVAFGILGYLRDCALMALSESIVTRLSIPVMEVSATSRGGPTVGIQLLRDLETLRVFLSSPTCLVPFDLVATPFLLMVFLFMHWAYLALAVACVVILCGLNVLGDSVTRKQMLLANEASVKGFIGVASAVGAADAVVAMRMLPAVTRRWDTSQGEALNLSHRAVMRSKAIASVMRMSRLAMTGAMVALGLVLVLGGHASSGSMVAGNMILARLLQPLQAFATTKRSWVDALSAWERIRIALNETVAVRYPFSLPEPEGALLVERLVHIPPGSDRPVLKGISFALAPGEILGIIGPAAAGKSTLARLIVGMESPSSGGAFLDGHSTYLWPRESFATHVGYVPQSVCLVDGTIAENIARMQTPDLRKVIDAAQLVGIHGAIAALPNGYSTYITASGATLSSGQRQRIALARALYGSPKLLVLDEPNAFLDKSGEESLVDLLIKLKLQGVGAIVITHRPSLVRAADKLLVLKDGLVDRMGGRDEILQAIGAPMVAVIRANTRVA